MGWDGWYLSWNAQSSVWDVEVPNYEDEPGRHGHWVENWSRVRDGYGGGLRGKGSPIRTKGSVTIDCVLLCLVYGGRRNTLSPLMLLMLTWKSVWPVCLSIT